MCKSVVCVYALCFITPRERLPREECLFFGVTSIRGGGVGGGGGGMGWGGGDNIFCVCVFFSNDDSHLNQTRKQGQPLLLGISWLW